MKISELKYATLLSYSPHENTSDALESKYLTYSLKQDRYEGQPPILMSDWVAKKTQENNGLFYTFFQSNTILVPVPSSSLMEKDTLWVPERIANALVKKGFGKQVASCLRRETAVRKATTSPSHERPSVKDHYDSLSVQGSLSEPEDILLIDDVITRGATLLGCANRLITAFPNCRINAFAAVRTISNPEKFKKLQDPCVGTIYLNDTGGTIRYP
ncbi:MAG: hypothetical protein LBQ98_01075 [Nitrososphaerota archaeon]|jgi:predicted amidophosphoribosyltransferase|nr:hypothetical protein [Nitrososphaerota archaeon]